MFYGNNINDTRQLFFTSWQKYQQKQPLQPLEEQIARVIAEHPEYHTLFEVSANVTDSRYFAELGQTNPFMHMGLHLAIRDQVHLNQPMGITKAYKKLLQKYKNSLVVEHMMMDYLAECLWQAQRRNTIPDEQYYLYAIKALLN